MKTNEINNGAINPQEAASIDAAELESIAASLPVRSNVRAGAAVPCHMCCKPY